MQQPQNNLAYCVRCNYALQSRPQGFFARSSQTGYSRADAYSAARRGQPVPYPPQPPPQNMSNPVQTMYDANGKQIYVQLMYDRTGKPVYVQMMPKITGYDAAGKPMYTMVPAAQVMPPPQAVPQQTMPQQQVMPQFQEVQPKKNSSFLDHVSETSSEENAAFIPKQNTVPPPVPVMPRPEDMPEVQNQISAPDRPAVRATAIASSMYTASQQNPAGTGSFFARVQQQKQQQYTRYEMPVSAEELLREEARTAFVQQDVQDEHTVLKQIFESRTKEYQMPADGENTAVSVQISSDEITSVSEKNLYKPPEKIMPKPAVKKSEEKPEIKPEVKPEPPKLFRGKKAKEKQKHKTIIVDPDEIFGDSKKHKVEMLGISVDGDERAVNDKIREMRYGGKKSVRSMKAADEEVSIESMVDDPLAGDAARKALTDEVVQKAYDSIESAEIAKALEQLNQGIFPKSIKE